ncbi:MAG TPA: glycoside hydrolase family 32 protein [Candidatus Sulfotelmatobacter sp.]|nr:glycoside hydrolase family 32 protein [Candidatus Sulfotelmatobacter sp.]
MPLSRRSFLQLFGAAAIAPSCARLLPESPSDAANGALCRKLAADPLRPQYHLLPAHNWMNDPNGPIFFRGRYHMFYQYNPQASVWGNMHWAHAISPDLIHWQHEPIALSPTPGGPDADGVFSGSAILDNGVPTLIYTGIAPPASDSESTLRDGTHSWRETQCLAVAQDDDLRTWKKLPMPVISTPPAGLAVIGFRDPSVWREGDRWMLTLGSGLRGKGGMVLLYTSSDLRHWTYLHPLIEGSSSEKLAAHPVDTGDMWECPDFFPLGDKHVLLISSKKKVHWKVGVYANQRFTPQNEGLLDWGSYYAAKTMLDQHGNRILWGWITESRPDAELIAAGWAGAMSLPRVLSVNSNIELETDVAPAAHRLRTAHTSIRADQAPAARQKILDTLRIHDLAAELDLQLQPKAEDFALHLQSDAGENFATIAFTVKSGKRELQINSLTAPVSGSEQSPIRLRGFLDGSILEIFANQTTSLTARVYKIPSGPLRLRPEGEVELLSLDTWQMKPISKDRLTGSLCP